MQVMPHLGEVEAVRPGQRQHDVVLGRRRLQLEIEFAANALAQRQPPGAVDAAAVGRMDDQLHAADFVEETLDDERLLGRQHAQCGMAAARYSTNCSAAGSAIPTSSISQRRMRSPSGSPANRAAISAASRDTDCDSSSVRPGASPSQNGMLGVMPCASSTRTVPRSTRWMR